MRLDTSIFHIQDLTDHDLSFDWTSTGIYTARLTTYFTVFLKFFLNFYRVYTTTLQPLIMAKVEGNHNVIFAVLLYAYLSLERKRTTAARLATSTTKG